MFKNKPTQSANRYAITSDKAWRLSKEWKNCALIWQTLDHIFTIGSFAASVGTIYIVSETDVSRFAIVTLSSISAILTLMSFACNPSKYKTNYRAAFQVLNEALVENTDKNGEIKNGDDNRKAIVDAIKQGERYIGNTFDTVVEKIDDQSKGNNDEKIPS